MEELEQKTIEATLQDEALALIFVHSPFCGTCHLARQMLTTIEATFGQEIFWEFNASLHPDLMKKYQIESVPCLLVTEKSRLIEKVYAFHSVTNMYEKVSNYVKE
ncbi:thioredoxin family protein [Halobacillus mangrovi]|uniref:Thiol reductase thioredoxin n=1 Tax=Halobacillus mangrovi TaxID=402384 RepID=A0A1W5ZTR9_9BACI|nr:thioredoxin family protein [Halobacillus mangrovi]ARI76665.1 thiol reductase thioredoxin [Halobacillus mangrovi]